MLEVILSNGKRFVTDFGESRTAVGPTGEEMHIPRYGVWEYFATDKAQVVYTTDNLHHAELWMLVGDSK